MPAPYWLAKYIATPLKKRMASNGKWDVIGHVGRVSGRAFRTPVEAFPVEGGFIVFVMYGSHKTDWVKNVMAEGSARLELKTGETLDVGEPTILDPETAWSMLPKHTQAAPSWANVNEYLYLKVT